ncbi:MAG: hypothetical protein IPN34_06460 [Planctomycetes bacterium]|nr:hypothetical protein [Planctomycetota bacterium]
MLTLLPLALLSFAGDGLRSDGARYERMIEHGSLAGPHFAFLPLAALFALFSSAHVAALGASVCAAVLGAKLVAGSLGRRLGTSGFALALLLLCLCPAFLVQGAAVEVHAAAFCLAAAAFALALRRGPTGGRARCAALAGFVLVLGHLSSAFWLPALACCSAGAPTPSGERADRGRRLAGASLAGGAAGLVFVFLCGWWATPLPGEELAPLRGYLRDWLSGAALPRDFAYSERWITEVSGALGPLLPLALCGAALSLRRGDRGAAGLALALCPGPLLALWIGAYECGAYLLPGLPAVIWLAVHALRALARAHPWKRALLLASLVLELAARFAWAGTQRLPRGDLAAGDAGLHAWSAALAAELGAPPSCAAALFLASAELALLAGRALAERAAPSSPASRGGRAAVVGCVLLQALAFHGSMLRSPSRDQSELAAFGRAFARSHGERSSHLLLGVEPTENARSILDRSAGPGRALFLPTRAYGLGDDAASAARAELDAQLPEARLLFPPDLFAPLVAARDAEAIAWMRSREAQGRAMRLREPELSSFALAPRWDPVAAAYAERAARELPTEARLVTCIPDSALRGTLAALHPRPFVDLAVDELPEAGEAVPLHLCDQGLGYALELAAASEPHARRLRELRERIARGEVERWRSRDPASHARANAFWESTRAGR